MPNLGQPGRMEQPVMVAQMPMREVEIPEHILEVSREHNYFIYNVSPWPYSQGMGSMGMKYIPGLDESLVLSDEHHVAGPLVIDGQPYETYPAEGHKRVIYHKSRNHDRNRKEWEGHDFARAVCGVGQNIMSGNNLLERGVFISKIADQSVVRAASDPSGELIEYRAPTEPNPKDIEAMRRYRAFMAEVTTAERALLVYSRSICVKANSYYASKKFEENRTDRMFQAAKFIKGTPAEYPWMSGTGDGMLNNVSCEGCGQTIKSGIHICPHCSYRVCSNEVWEKVKGRYPNRAS